MEQGQWDEANTEKVRLEEKQRGVRRLKELEAEQAAADGLDPEPYQPIWFSKITDEQNGGKLIHVYKGGYWEAKKGQDWSACPDIFWISRRGKKNHFVENSSCLKLKIHSS